MAKVLQRLARRGLLTRPGTRAEPIARGASAISVADIIRRSRAAHGPACSTEPRTAASMRSERA